MASGGFAGGLADGINNGMQLYVQKKYYDGLNKYREDLAAAKAAGSSKSEAKGTDFTEFDSLAAPIFTAPSSAQRVDSRQSVMPATRQARAELWASNNCRGSICRCSVRRRIMNELIKVDQAITMSSREIAELTGKRHDHVMRDIRLMLIELHGEEAVPGFGGSYTGQDNTARPCFNLPKRETLILVSGYNLAMRAKIIDRWQELEQKAPQAQDVHAILSSPESLRKLLAGYVDQVIEQQAVIEKQEGIIQEQTPKAEFFDAVADASNCQTVFEVAKELGVGSQKLFKFLKKQAILMEDNLPYQNYIDSGYFKVILKKYRDKMGETRTYHQTLVTGKGIAFIQRRLAKSGIPA
jgi:Rha family phage regulatory protein